MGLVLTRIAELETTNAPVLLICTLLKVAFFLPFPSSPLILSPSLNIFEMNGKLWRLLIVILLGSSGKTCGKVAGEGKVGYDGSDIKSLCNLGQVT